ncbi:hypothetical protein TUM20984_44680 [Mycobacterium antarcticum]|nr:hypothetical protein TUM20984_44680 [Mycolicibacterium sp. TUM20984]
MAVMASGFVTLDTAAEATDLADGRGDHWSLRSDSWDEAGRDMEADGVLERRAGQRAIT